MAGHRLQLIWYHHAWLPLKTAVDGQAQDQHNRALHCSNHLYSLMLMMISKIRARNWQTKHSNLRKGTSTHSPNASTWSFCSVTDNDTSVQTVKVPRSKQIHEHLRVTTRSIEHSTRRRPPGNPWRARAVSDDDGTRRPAGSLNVTAAQPGPPGADHATQCMAGYTRKFRGSGGGQATTKRYWHCKHHTLKGKIRAPVMTQQ
jgi:hypothetical protein